MAHFYNYALHGLRVRSEIPLGTVEASRSDASPDLEIVLGRSHAIPGDAPRGTVIASAAHRDRPGEAFYTAVTDDGGHLLRIHGSCDLRLRPALDRLECHIDPGADPDLVAVYLAGLAAALVLGLLGQPILHASAVAVPELGGEVVALAGGAGVGKSTVTALLCATGCAFITDDLLRLGFSEERALSIGGCPELRLRTGSAHVLDGFGGGRPSVRSTADGRLLLRLARGEAPTNCLRAVVVPRPARGLDHVRTERLDAGTALMVLTRHPKLEGWTSPAVVRMQFEALARLVASTPVFLARVPWLPRPDIEGAKELVAELARLT